ncbi:MAG: hypothetical protein R3351_01595, partial [Nitrospirales bacterium]|nr:hypothetical protein [Nitrospirales bacterium]
YGIKTSPPPSPSEEDRVPHRLRPNAHQVTLRGDGAGIDGIYQMFNVEPRGLAYGRGAGIFFLRCLRNINGKKTW